MKIIQLVLAPLLFFLSACSILKGNKTILDLEIRFNESAPILYGHSIDIHVYAIYSNGKEREITHKNECSLSVVGGTYSRGTISIPNYPTSPLSDTLIVQASYAVNEKSWNKEIKIPFNYLNHLTVSFNGNAGVHGSKGKDKGTPLIVRNGNDGETGEDGASGENGHQLALYIWKENPTDCYQITVNDLITNTFYFYTFRDRGYGLNFILNGGSGGNGGNGGDGGTGKDGSITDKKSKDPGDGGNGGNGGNGGLGGNGGSAIIFLHPNAIELEKKMSITNNGGQGGQAGKGGDQGLAGEALSGQNTGQKGSVGQDGNVGMNGVAGDPYQLIIEEFEF